MPPVVLAVKLMGEPTQTGLLLPDVGVGCGLMVTVVEVVAVQPLLVTVTVYVPLVVAVTVTVFVAPVIAPPAEADHA